MKKLISVAVAIAAAAVFLATPTARAEPAAFDATVRGTIVRGQGCPNGSYLCGTADIDGRGSAAYRWYLESFVPVSEECGEYTATVTFTLDDGSVLTLDESGTDCGPGGSFGAYPPFSYGQPQEASGAWSITSGTGSFTGLAGDGTNRIQVAGAHLHATYEGSHAVGGTSM